MVLSCTATGKILSCGFLEGDVLVHELLGKISGVHFFWCVCFSFVGVFFVRLWFFFVWLLVVFFSELLLLWGGVFFVVIVSVFVWLVFCLFSLNAEYFLPSKESLPGDLVPLPHLAAHNFSGSLGASLPCYNKPAVSQLIPVVLVFAGSRQHSLLPSAKPHDAATCQPPCWECPFPLALGSSEHLEPVAGWCQGHPRGSRAQSKRLLLTFKLSVPLSGKFGRFEIQRPNH